MDAWNPESWKLGFKDAARSELLRNSAGKARIGSGIEPKRLVSSARAAASAQAFDILRACSLDAPLFSPDMLQRWDHANASFWLSASEAHGKAFDYNEAELAAAATVRAAEFEVSRRFAEESAHELIFKMLEAANGQILSCAFRPQENGYELRLDS